MKWDCWDAEGRPLVHAWFTWPQYGPWEPGRPMPGHLILTIGDAALTYGVKWVGKGQNRTYPWGWAIGPHVRDLAWWDIHPVGKLPDEEAAAWAENLKRTVGDIPEIFERRRSHV